ncbi:MAG: hypothetical protein AAFY39_00990 [Pseudomonadota bacterium]
MRRTATITLHWLTLTLLLVFMAAGPVPVIAWAFGLSGLAMCGIALVNGLMNGPGPKLEGVLRTAHPWLSRGMYLAVGATSVATIWYMLGGTVPGPRLEDWLMYLLSIGALHGIFHLWRHTALGDGVLRRMTPKSMHKSL